MPFPFPLVLLAHLTMNVADTVPRLDVTGSCRGSAGGVAAADAKAKIKSCFDSENRTRDELRKKWFGYSRTDRAYCVGTVKGYNPTYTELATCLDLKDALRGISGKS